MNRFGFLIIPAFCAALVLLPLFAGEYLLSIATLFLFFAYTGQAWNILMGFAGQLSLGHAAYLGLGAYSVAALQVHFSITPLAGLWISVALCASLAALIGGLAFRYRVSGVHFTLLTIAVAEFLRIGFDHWSWLGGSGGLFLKVAQRDHFDLLALRGPPEMFYYIILTLTGAAWVLSSWLLRSRAGYYWLAIREDEEAARALGIDTFRWKMLAMMLSAALTSLGGVFLAFYYNNLFPEQIFHISRSIEMILGPIIGGVGTLFGPILGAALLALLGDGATEILAAIGWDVPGLKQLIYGFALLLAILLVPQGLWPLLARRFGGSR